MADKYIHLSVSCIQSITDILIAELSMIGFDAFIEQEDSFEASINKFLFDEASIKKIFSYYSSTSKIEYSLHEIQEKNWNEAWEKDHEPVIIRDICMIRAEFHKVTKRYPIDIIINPKMSFGTGHHETTRMMIEILLDLYIENGSVLDVGCGTGILSIISEKRGAEKITALDTDSNAAENALENLNLNKCSNIDVMKGDILTLDKRLTFDIILVNISRNIIIGDFPYYVEHMKKEGKLILSGFLAEDNQKIIQKAETHALKLTNKITENNWSALVFEKKSK